MSKRVYLFGAEMTEGSKTDAPLLGNKAANLSEMAKIGIPVPPGFAITTAECNAYLKTGGLTDELKRDIDEAVKKLETAVGRKFGDTKDPLLFSVRSGAIVSMPGMMDTILNLGLSKRNVLGLAEISRNEKFAYDTFRRLVQMFGDVVCEVPSEEFEEILDANKRKYGYKVDSEFTAKQLQEITERFLGIFRKHTKRNFPEDPREQLMLAVEAVFKSWHAPRAASYRRINGIPGDLGTSATVQTMVFGNRGEDSATGVLFTRDPSTGKKVLMGEFLQNAQGEDVVAGIRTPSPIQGKGHTLEGLFPPVYKELMAINDRLESHFKDMQDVEFTVENNRLWMLQTRNGKRTAHAAVQVAVDLVKEGLIDEKTAVLRVKPAQLDQLLHPVFDPKAKTEVVAKGLPASPGAVSGKCTFTANDAKAWTERGEKVILVRLETSPEDIEGMHAAQGILTARGGMTSHAAVVARGMGKCCIAGCGDIDVHHDEKYFVTKSGLKFKEGEIISLNGSTGEVLKGEVKTIQGQVEGPFEVLLGWADKFRKMGVRTNADTPADCRTARKFGAEGIGLCRTEHMFFDKTRIDVVRQMILAKTPEERVKPLEKIQQMQLEDFKGIFEVMDGLPVTIRLLDPPLHEFLPANHEEIKALASRLKIDAKELETRVEGLKEFNPMLGHRGCRLGITFPDIYDMQMRAIMLAACELDTKTKVKVLPEIMIPVVADPKEFNILKTRLSKIADEIKGKYGSSLKYWVGTMIELPRAALLAGEIAKEAEFFSFGTNDLTQTVYGLSRDDGFRFVPEYIEQGIFPKDPFATLDPSGVFELVRMGTDRGRATNPKLKVGICGEHGGDPDSIKLFYEAGLNYVSCSPFRVPLARLQAAQISIEKPRS
ncbi:MAG: pyruvate, phosphate dikinase [Pseudomonadota bacterium]